MSNVTRIRHELPVTMDIVHAVSEFDAARQGSRTFTGAVLVCCMVTRTPRRS